MRIGIHVAWNKQESAYLAGQLADLATALGHTVSILSTQPISGPVYSSWDEYVLPHTTDFGDWAKRQRTVIWFDVQAEKLASVRARGGRNILILLWHRLSAPERDLLGMFDGIVCPSQSILQHMIHHNSQLRLLRADWDPLVSISVPSRADNCTRVFVPMESYTARKAGPMIIHALQIVAEMLPETRFTIGQCQHWSRPALDALSGAVRALPKRFSTAKRTSWQSWLGLLDNCDWVFNPAIQENTALTNLAALYKRLPIAAFDIPPVDDILRSGRSGVLVSCDIEENNWLVPTAVPTPKKLVETLAQCLCDRALAESLTGSANVNRLQRRRETFYKFWETELGKIEQWE